MYVCTPFKILLCAIMGIIKMKKQEEELCLLRNQWKRVYEVFLIEQSSLMDMVGKV